jgi:putative PIN family toxin of toxin-antitoxin system
LHIPQAEVDELLWLLQQTAEHIGGEPLTIPAICRDSKDNYLLAYATIAQVDLLVSGDHDLLELGEFEGVRIVSPATFAALLVHSD